MNLIKKMGRRKEVKRCIECGVKISKKNSSGYCKICYRRSPRRLKSIREKNKRMYYKNIDKIKKYYQENKEKKKEYRKEYYQKNKEYILKNNKEYYQKNKEKIKNGKRSINKNKNKS